MTITPENVLAKVSRSIKENVTKGTLGATDAMNVDERRKYLHKMHIRYWQTQHKHERSRSLYGPEVDSALRKIAHSLELSLRRAIAAEPGVGGGTSASAR